jgi:hypothetical protein
VDDSGGPNRYRRREVRMNNTDTVPKVSRCSECGALVLGAWTAGVRVAVGVATLAPDAAALAFTSGHAVYRVRSTRRPTLAAVTDPVEIIDHRAYVLGHTCPEPHDLPASA